MPSGLQDVEGKPTNVSLINYAYVKTKTNQRNAIYIQYIIDSIYWLPGSVD